MSEYKSVYHRYKFGAHKGITFKTNNEVDFKERGSFKFLGFDLPYYEGKGKAIYFYGVDCAAVWSRVKRQEISVRKMVTHIPNEFYARGKCYVPDARGRKSKKLFLSLDGLMWLVLHDNELGYELHKRIIDNAECKKFIAEFLFRRGAGNVCINGSGNKEQHEEDTGDVGAVEHAIGSVGASA